MTSCKTLIEAIDNVSSGSHGVTFIEGKDKQTALSYAELRDKALLLLAYFQDRGLKPGDEMIILTRDNQTFVTVFWACVMGGMVPVPVAVGISDEHRGKLFRIFNKLQRGYLYTSQDTHDRLQKFALANVMQADYDRLAAHSIVDEQIPALNQSGVIHKVKPDDLGFIQFSSGSTSDPKGVLLTHKNIIVNTNAIAAGGAYSENDTTLSWMPLTHDMGLIGFHINMLNWNMNQNLMPTDLFSRRPLLWMQKASEQKANVLCSPNFGYKHFLKALGDKKLENVDLSHVRLIYNGAEPISVELCDEFLSRMAEYGLKRETMFTVYGLAEATLAVAFPKVHEPYRAVELDRHSLVQGDKVEFTEVTDPDAVSFAIEGPAINDIEIKITGSNNETLPEDVIGDVQIKGPSVTQGYYLNEQANATALTGDGWLNTGDLGFLHEGELIITGRSKDIIFANGLNYYPHDIEEIILNHTDMELGKVVAYGVRPEKSQEDELIIFLLYRKDLDDFKPLVKQVSKIVNEQTGLTVAHVLPVNRVPKTTSGKLQRRLLADAYVEGEYDAIIAELNPSATKGDVQTPIDVSDAAGLPEKLRAICAEPLKDHTVAVSDNFFEVGISSLTLAEMHEKIDVAYPGLIDVVDLFEYQTFNDVARLIEEKQAG